jgi:hypothetical protein
MWMPAHGVRRKSAWRRCMDQPAKQTKYKKIVIENLYQAIANVRSQYRHESVRAQARYVIEILKRDYGVSVPVRLQKTIARRIKEFSEGKN